MLLAGMASSWMEILAKNISHSHLASWRAVVFSLHVCKVIMICTCSCMMFAVKSVRLSYSHMLPSFHCTLLWWKTEFLLLVAEMPDLQYRLVFLLLSCHSNLMGFFFELIVSSDFRSMLTDFLQSLFVCAINSQKGAKKDHFQNLNSYFFCKMFILIKVI